jgi:hypothetical protein
MVSSRSHALQPNLRADCAIFAVTGGAQYPLVIGASNTISVMEPNLPSGVRVALVNNTHMRISWETRNASNPQVRAGGKKQTSKHTNKQRSKQTNKK